MPQRVLLTGATGFVGSHTVKALIDAGHDVLVLIRPTTPHEHLKKLPLTIVYGTLETIADLKIAGSIDTVLHVAGAIKVRTRRDFYRINTDTTQDLLEWSKKKKIKHFVLVSSISARGPDLSERHTENTEPVSDYGKSKRLAEDVAERYRKYFEVTVVRPPVVYGPGDRETSELFRWMKRGLLPVAGGMKRRVSFVYVEDLARFLVHTVSKPPKSDLPLYPEDGKGGYTWDEVRKIASEVYKRRVLPLAIPLWMVKRIAKAGDVMAAVRRKPVFLTLDKFEEIRQMSWTCSNEAYVSCYPKFGGTVKLKEGLTRAAKWYREEGWW
jgi:nucleoside-diphosphate-sugar epimerase